jgi:pimeloyl-ACP methyl ester carboxylesterase
MNPAQNYTSPEAYSTAMAVYDQALDRWPVPLERGTVATSLGEAFVLSFGDRANPPLVLLHGSGANSSSWGFDAAAFAAAFRVFAIDLPGETGRSTGVRPHYAGSVYPDWLAEVFDALGLESACVCGLSLGGWLALRFAATHPDRVSRLAVLAPGGVVPARETFTRQADDLLPTGEAGIRELAAAVFHPQELPPGVIEGFVFMQSLYKTRRDDLPPIPDSELRSITAPALFIGGEQDALLDMPSTAARLRTFVPTMTVELDPAAGHVLVGRGARVAQFLAADS